MATLNKEQIEQKMQQLKQLAGEISALTKELAEAGVIKLSEEDLEKVSGGGMDDEFYIPPTAYKETKIEKKQEPLSEWDKRLVEEFAIIDKKRKKR